MKYIRQGDRNFSSSEVTTYYLCYQQNGEICVDVNWNTWLKSKEGDQMPVVRLKDDNNVYHENSEDFRRYFVYVQVLFGLCLVATLYLLFKTFIPDGSEDFGDDPPVTTIFDEYE